MRFLAIFILASVVFSFPVQAASLSGKKIGVLLMHGKGGTDSLIASLADDLRSEGVMVVTPLMPWSLDRTYDKSYEESMGEITTHVAALKARGAERIVLAGHSLGANAALGYSARHAVSGIVLLAYGHVPGKKGFARKMAGNVEKARKMIRAGQGEKVSDFKDRGGVKNTVHGTANDILSWFDSEGPATTVNNAPNVKADTPVLCIDGARDEYGKRCGWILSMVPETPGNRKAMVDADHKRTPAASGETVINWLASLN